MRQAPSGTRETPPPSLRSRDWQLLASFPRVILFCFYSLESSDREGDVAALDFALGVW